MDIEILEMAERKAKFLLKNSSPAMANALRRTLLSDLPKMAIHKVDFHLGPLTDDTGKEYESATPLFDEIIAHRLGMIPIPTYLDEFVPQDECSCGGEGCSSCTMEYFLNKSGPCTVFSGDLLPMTDPSHREAYKVKDEFIPIVELVNGQGINVIATAVMGTAKKHVKWQVCNGVGYKYLPRIAIDPKVASRDDVLECAALCPKKVFDVVDGKLVVANELDCSLRRAHQGRRGHNRRRRRHVLPLQVRDRRVLHRPGRSGRGPQDPEGRGRGVRGPAGEHRARVRSSASRARA